MVSVAAVAGGDCWRVFGAVAFGARSQVLGCTFCFRLFTKCHCLFLGSARVGRMVHNKTELLHNAIVLVPNLVVAGSVEPGSSFAAAGRPVECPAVFIGS